jgi:DHA1 family tetracycline resistance protein-like MFS transporter
MSLLSKRVDVDQQGQLQGSLAILFGAGQLVGPLIYTNVFAWAVRDGAWLHLPGLPMLVGSALLLVAVGLAFVYARAAPETIAPETIAPGTVAPDMPISSTTEPLAPPSG